jgi:Tfp pilus assembly protein PilV
MLLNRELIMTRQKIPSAKFAHKGKPAQQGVVLLEALIAILLFSMGVLALVGLQAIQSTVPSPDLSRSKG